MCIRDRLHHALHIALGSLDIILLRADQLLRARELHRPLCADLITQIKRLIACLLYTSHEGNDNVAADLIGCARLAADAVARDLAVFARAGGHFVFLSLIHI